MRRRGIGRVGRPSLLGVAATTAVVAGTATAVSGGMRRHQAENANQAAEAQAYEQQQQQAAMQAAAQQAAAQQAAMAPPPAPAAGGLSPDAMAQLQQLAQMKDQGILTEEEFAAQKAKILGG